VDDFLIYSGYLILLLNLILYTYSFFRKEKANVFFVLYLAFITILQFCMELMYHLRMNNLFFVNIFFVGQMVLLGLFYHSILKLKTQRLFVKLGLGLALLVLAVQFMMDYSQFLKFNLLEIVITSLLVVFFALMYLYNMLTDTRQYYYITIGLIIYLLVSTVLFLVGNLTVGLSDDLKYLTWRLNAFFVLTSYLFVLYEWKVSFNPAKKINS